MKKETASAPSIQPGNTFQHTLKKRILLASASRDPYLIIVQYESLKTI